MQVSLVNRYLAHKQHLLPASRHTDVVQITRDVVALHATDPTAPCLSLWARTCNFQCQTLEDALYSRRELARVHCMRTTLHVVPSEDVPYFFQAYAKHRARVERDDAALLMLAGLCHESEAGTRLKKLHHEVMSVLAQKGSCTVRKISQAVPDLEAKVRHSVGKPYEGEFSIGSRLIPDMCTLGQLVRTRPGGTWRSNLYEYAVFSDWLPGIALKSVSPRQARAWLVQRYLFAFGPATFDDVVWWTGFSKSQAKGALRALGSTVAEVSIEGLDNCLLLADDVQRLYDLALPDARSVFFLPGLDPYIMGYHDRRRFLTPEHHAKVFDRAGNAMPTVWANHRVVGAWGQRKDGSVVYGLFEPVGKKDEALLAREARRLESFLDGEYLAPRIQTPFTRALGKD
jgi:DNA glycosylase AlkZ-like